jgi:hypothetical protein
MAKKLQLRGGTTSQHSSFTGAVREVTVDTDKKVIVVHDGSTAGGIVGVKASDLNSKQDVVANVSDTEIGYLNGVTSAIQTQIDSKQATITGSATTIDTESLTANRAVISNGSQKIAVSAVTDTELGHVSGVTSGIQTQIDSKQATIANDGLSGDKVHGGTISAFTSTGIDDNAGSTAVTIDTNQKVGIGTTTPGSFEAEASQLVVGTTSGNNGMTIASGTSNTGNIYFADGTTTNQKYRGWLSFSHSTEDMSFGTGANTRMTLDNTGKLGINTAGPSSLLHVKSSGASSTPFRIERSGGSGDEVKVAMQGDNRPFFQMYQSGTEKIRFDVGSNSFITNNLAIGSTSPSEKLHVTGNILATGNITAYSDKRIKKDIKELDNCLEAVEKIRGVSYKRTDTGDDGVGVIAQEVEALFPELISEDNDGMKSVNYSGLIGVLFSAVKELSTEVKRLKEERK